MGTTDDVTDHDEIEVSKILELDSPIVQISLSPADVDYETKVVISTENQTVICDTLNKTFVEVGNQKRFVAIIFKQDDEGVGPLHWVVVVNTGTLFVLAIC